jgi:4,5-dihydroxyphthalate decarboxylase
MLGLDRMDGSAGARDTAPIADRAPFRSYRTVLGYRAATAALLDGAIDLPGFAIERIERQSLPPAFAEMVRDGAFDICEMALGTYLLAREHSRAFTAIPIFPLRGLHHGAIMVNRYAGITGPGALAGRSVGVARGYTATSGIWARGILQDEYGVDPASVTWLVEGDEHVPEYALPPIVRKLSGDRPLNEMLARGEIGAAIGIAPGHPDIVPLVPDAFERGLRAVAADGFLPINHLVVVRDDVLAADPGLAPALCRAFAESRLHHLVEIAEGKAVPDRLTEHVLALGRDPLPYGIAANRPMLERMMRYAVAQGVIGAPMAIDGLFAVGTEAFEI